MVAAFPRVALILGEAAGEQELSIGGEQHPGPAFGLFRVAEGDIGPAQHAFQELQVVLDIEPAKI